MRHKLDNLERVVKGLRGGVPETAGSQETAKNGPGNLRITSEEETFVGPAHWESIVNDIAEVKAHLDSYPDLNDSAEELFDNYSSPSDSGHVATPDLFFHGRPSMSLADLISALPSKALSDRLVAAWFGSMDNHKHIVHLPTFQRQYADFWSDHSTASPVWLALLLNILALGSQYLSRTPAADNASQPGAQLHALAAHAIILADYAKPKMYILEALVLYIRYGQMQADSSELKLWLTLGIVTRLATRMGIFRDAGTSDGVPPFVAEMRRRLWLCICYMDIIFSYHIGLVSVIKGLPANAAPPSNLNDSDFGPESKTLPTAWPMEKFTNMTYVIVLGQLTNAFAETVTVSNALVPPTELEVAELDQEIRRIGESMPEVLKMRPLDESFGDAPALIMERFRLDAVYTKNMCVLYRRYLRSDHYVNRRKCTDAASQILVGHGVLAEAIQPTGQLEMCHYQEVRDCMDCFILAGIIIGVELSDTSRDQCYSTAQLDQMRELLSKSCNIWMSWTFAPRKARRAAFAMGKMLDKYAASRLSAATHSSQADEGAMKSVASVPTVQDAALGSGSGVDLAMHVDLPDFSTYPDIFETVFDDQSVNWVSLHQILLVCVADLLPRECGTRS